MKSNCDICQRNTLIPNNPMISFPFKVHLSGVSFEHKVFIYSDVVNNIQIFDVIEGTICFDCLAVTTLGLHDMIGDFPDDVDPSFVYLQPKTPKGLYLKHMFPQYILDDIALTYLLEHGYEGVNMPGQPVRVTTSEV